MDTRTTHSIAEKTIVAKASHALVTLLSILLMALAFSHPVRSEEAGSAQGGRRGAQDSQVDANAESLGHVIVPAKEFLRKAQAFKSPQKKWHPADSPVSVNGCNPATHCPAPVAGNPSFARSLSALSRSAGNPANPARAPPSHLFPR